MLQFSRYTIGVRICCRAETEFGQGDNGGSFAVQSRVSNVVYWSVEKELCSHSQTTPDQSTKYPHPIPSQPPGPPPSCCALTVKQCQPFDLAWNNRRFSFKIKAKKTMRKGNVWWTIYLIFGLCYKVNSYKDHFLYQIKHDPCFSTKISNWKICHHSYWR